ncbi:MAG: hypothetical protein ACE5H9_03445 [Anaerolineae bacterium]
MQQEKPARSRFGLLAILGAAVTLLLIIVAALGFYVLGPQNLPPEELFTDPAAAINADEIDPALAVGALGGVADAQVVREAINKDRANTALASLVHSPRLTDRQRAGDLLLLAERFADNGDVTRAQLSYQLAGTIATLSPELSDTIRVDTFLQAGRGLANLGKTTVSLAYLDQAYVLAAYSPFLQAAYRRRVFEQLHSMYQSNGNPDKARASLDMLAQIGQMESLPEEPLVLPEGIALATSSDVQAREAQRWGAAQIVARELVERGGRTTPESLQALQEALLAEDESKAALFQEALTTAPQLSAQIGVMQAQIEWLSIKYRVARKNYGISLVPAWEAQVEQIRSELTKSYETLFALYADLIVALPDASQIDKATEEALRREILSGQLGLYPNYPEEQRRRQLLEASEQLARSRPDSNLQLSSIVAGSVEMYTIIPKDESITGN